MKNFSLLIIVLLSVSFTPKQMNKKIKNVNTACGSIFTMNNYNSSGCIVKRVVYCTSGGLTSVPLNLVQGDSYNSNLLRWDDNTLIIRTYGTFDYIELIDNFDVVVERIYFDPSQYPWGEYNTTMDGFYGQCWGNNRINIY